MSSHAILTPGPDHPITIERSYNRVLVRIGEAVIADTQRALILREAAYSPVYYFPRGNVDMAQLEPSNHQSYCPYKGEAAYFHLSLLGPNGANAVWSYERPFEAVAAIAGHLAFYPDRVTISEQPAV